MVGYTQKIHFILDSHNHGGYTLFNINGQAQGDTMNVSYFNGPDFLTTPEDKYDLAANIAILGVDAPREFKLKAVDQRKIFGFNLFGGQNIRIEETGVTVWVSKCFGHDYDAGFFSFERLFELVQEKKRIYI